MVTGELIPLAARLVLIDIMTAADVNSCEVTSVARTPADQARVMYENLIGTGPQQGEQKQHDLYREPGDLVIDVFQANMGKPRDQIIELMRQKIVELGPQTVSHHCCDPAILTVFDVGPNSIDFTKRLAFESAAGAAVAAGRVGKFLSPHTADPAYHFEIAVDPPAAIPTT